MLEKNKNEYKKIDKKLDKRFDEYREMLNVVISRAKNRLVIVGDFNEAKKCKAHVGKAFNVKDNEGNVIEKIGNQIKNIKELSSTNTS